MIDTEKTLEFNLIKEKLLEFAYTKKAKDEIKNLKPYMSESELQIKLRETTQAKLLIDKMGKPPLTGLIDIHNYIQIAEKGGCLTEEELESVGVTLNSIKRLKDYLCRSKQLDVGISYFEENLDSLEDIRSAIDLNIRYSKVVDGASKLLKTLRSNIDVSKQKMREKADSIMRGSKEYMSDTFSTIRNNHICIPVKKEYKHKVSGSVLDKSATGNTLFIEPTSVGMYYDKVQNLEFDEENEVRRILYSLTGMLADVVDIMDENSRTIEKLDFMFAKASLSFEYDCVEPQINTERRIVLTNARHPLMDKNISIPLKFEIGNGINGIIITGPNAGGKTVAIKTVALNCLMAQCGLHVACEKADICMNNAYLCDIGDGQNITENLSTFSSHIKKVLEILNKADKDSLVILDELGSGTDPTEGMGIAIAILNELKNSGALYLVTTHYPEVKNYAEKEDGVINARMTFDKESLKPLYQLVIGEAGESCAFYIASKLGMPATMLRHAMKAAYGNESIKDLYITTESADFVKEKTSHIQRKKETNHHPKDTRKYQIGDSVMIYPDKKIGIVCKEIDEKGVMQVQLPDKKIYINHKRVKLHVAATKLYPEDYDFSIIFDSVENRKLRHQMERKYVKDIKIEEK